MKNEKIQHEKIIDIVKKVAATATDLGILVNCTQDSALSGRHITIKGEKLLYFGSCGYLGLEHDERIKNGAIEAIHKYGTQFSSSRAYVSSSYYQQAEELLRQMFGNNPVLLMQSLTVGHMSNIPNLVNNDDAVIMDMNAHESMQMPVQSLKHLGVHVEIIRHNNMERLESKINSLRNKYKKIWFMADSVYSMFGDFAPVKELFALADKYEQLHLYIDDIHGMSWSGPNGTGYVLSQVSYHPRLFLTTGLTKGFGTAGGLLIYPDENSYVQSRNTSKSFIFSIQMPPMILGATIASARIHLTDEITKLQNELQIKIKYFNDAAKKAELPIMHDSNSPIMFIRVGKPDVGYNVVRRMMNNGYYLNLSVFPSVAYNSTGLRIPINKVHTFEDIDNLISELKIQIALAKEDCTSDLKELTALLKLTA